MSAERIPTVCDTDDEKLELLERAVAAALEHGPRSDDLTVFASKVRGQNDDAHKGFLPKGLEPDDFDGVNIEAALAAKEN